MSGIAGIAYPDIFQTEKLIVPMLEIMGREKACHSLTFSNIQLGSLGNPPCTNSKRTIYLTLDGILYNPKHLFKELAHHGFTSPYSLGSALLEAYELWGIDFLKKIDGDFALSILDLEKKKLILARDRIGKKSLYWYYGNRHFIFASRIKSLLATGLIPLTPALDSIASYLQFGYFPQDLTPIQEITKLLPSHYLVYHFNNSLSIDSYWSYSSFFEKTTPKHPNLIVQDIKSELERAVAKRIPDDKSPLTCYLAGGFGSALTTVAVSEEAKERLISCSVGFSGENEEDIQAAKLAADELGIEHKVEMISKDEILNGFAELIWELDEPIADPNAIATKRLALLVSKYSSILFTGMGSDELFAGHTRYSLEKSKPSALKRFIHAPIPYVSRALAPTLANISRPLALWLVKESRSDPWQYEYLKQNALFGEEALKKAAPRIAGLFDVEVFLHKFHHLGRIKSMVSSFLYFDVKTRLADCYILQYEHLLTERGVRFETPFLDQSLVEFAASIPEPEEFKESDAAFFLKQLLKGTLPPAYYNRPKKVRRSFLAGCTNTSAMGGAFLLLENGALIENGIIDKEWLAETLSTPLSREQNFPKLYALLVLEVWFQLFINNPLDRENSKHELRELIGETK
ncbi:asparagine synthetase B family protein [Estrella lausannensis]|uniref:asparagine synthase (glutamine-hydrolyzing) n=1 Tax=Estrella lausannensis TaxID=483423 RepID=A0A0H5DR81_9BACT|nr:asparagine synthase-related protein [Estrella lausannensis]CRX38678.1 Asparagine synthetase [Estrella lausannensis]